MNFLKKPEILDNKNYRDSCGNQWRDVLLKSLSFGAMTLFVISGLFMRALIKIILQVQQELKESS